MTTTSAPSGAIAILDDIFVKPFEAAFADVKGLFSDLAKSATEEVAAAAQQALSSLATAEQTAGAALTAAQGQATAALNPIVQGFVKAGAAAIEADVPGLSALVGLAEPGAEAAATQLSDTVLTAAIHTLAGALSQSAKATAAVSLSNLAGAG